MNRVENNRKLYKSLTDRGYIEVNNILYSPAQIAQMIDAGTYTPPKRKQRVTRIKTAWVDDSLNINNRDNRIDQFTALIKQETGLTAWPEFRFLLPPDPDYRFDYAIPIAQDNHILKIAIEVDGGIYARGNSGHSSPTGIARDMDKATHAALNGWTLIRVTPVNLNTIATLDMIRKAIALKSV